MTNNATTICTKCADRLYKNAKPPKAKRVDIKIHLPGEWIWAIDVGNNQATLNNMPLADGYAYGDLVEYHPDTKGVIRLVEHRFDSGLVTYDPGKTEADTEKAYKKLYVGLEKHKVLCEGWMAGHIRIAFPKTMKVGELAGLVKKFGGVLRSPKPKPAERKGSKAKA